MGERGLKGNFKIFSTERKKIKICKMNLKQYLEI